MFLFCDILKLKVYIYIYEVKWKLLSCVRLCDPMEYSPPVSFVHGILQARTLEWVAIPFSTHSAGGFFTVWATREAIYKHTHTHTHICIYIYTHRHTHTHLAVEWLDHMVVLFLDIVFHNIFQTVFHNGCTNLQSRQQYTSIPFPYILDNTWFLQTFADIYLNRCEIIAHHCFDIYFSDS